MPNTATKQAEELLIEALKELESPKGSVQSGVQKLLRASRILGDEDASIWCEVQLCNSKYVNPLKNYATKLYALAEKKDTKSQEEFNDAKERLEKIGFKHGVNTSVEEIQLKADKSGGGYNGIGFIEERYASLVRSKVGNDGTYYEHNLDRHIKYVRATAHRIATRLYNRVAFSNTPQTSLDLLRAEVENKLLDLNPELAEKLMIAFKSVASDNPEAWSQALTTCRRFIEELADTLYPPREDIVNGRSLGKTNYINRLWAFMDTSIESDSNRELAKAHVDYLGSYLQRIQKISNKGVHTGLARIEAIKAVFHTYLMVADILDYLKQDVGGKTGKLNIHTATLDELESVLGVTRNQAKEIIKLRVQEGVLEPKSLALIKGIGPKTITKAKELFSFEPVK
jgi:hypothetical protein